ncbi:MAG TPA: argininosuccinate lyase [Gemmatimonadaceae bacterium]|jgi:argininosuccinate lyase|nr:argininosuccinate lyase [Gemmatimonadaceae bacterium]
MSGKKRKAAANTETHKLWGGRFSGGPHPALDAVNRSIGVDFRLWPHDVRLSKAWASALAHASVLTSKESAQIMAGLDAVAARIVDGAKPVATDEDVHTMIDRLLHEEAGAVASRLHTGRSRNDQVATATRLWTMEACDSLDVLIVSLQRAMIAQAEKLQRAVMPAYTHLQRAQPVTGAHWMLSHFWPLQRDRERLKTARNHAASLPLGSGAIAGSAFPVARARLAKSLGFSKISENSIDAVGDRDFIAEVLFALALTGAHLSRLAEDLILFGSSEFAFVRYGDAFSTGSSMMPQKRNPDALELARGSSARMLGDLVALLATIKGLPSGYNKDLQEDKRTLFDAADGMTLLLPAVAGSLEALMFDTARMEAAVTSTMMATDLADYLVRKRVTFREAHGAVGQLVREAEEKSVELGALPFASFKSAHAAFDINVMTELAPAASLANREIDGGTGPKSVARQLVAAKAAIRANV